MRPHIDGDYHIKFKAEALPLKEGLGGIACSTPIMSSSTWRARSERPHVDGALAQALPALRRPWEKDERAELVSGTIVEEVLQDIGELDFGKRMRAKCNVALWRNRGDHARWSASSPSR